MASLELFGFEGLGEAYLRILNIPWEEKVKALDEMAEVGMTKIRAQGENMGVRDPESDVHILDKMKRRPPVQTDSGGYEDVVFSGSRRNENGSRRTNAAIAFENEFGNRAQTARPFIQTALETDEDEITEPAERFGDWIEAEFNSD